MTNYGEFCGDELEILRRGRRNRARRLTATAPGGTPRASVDGDIGRRRVLAAAMFITLAPLNVLFGGPLTAAVRSPRRAATDNLVQLLSNRTSVVRVGTAYLVTAPEDADPNVAIDRMRRHGDALASALETGSPGQVRTLAARDMREDFAEGRIVKVDGWLLSQTEARLCALALMLCSGSPWRHRAVGL